MQAKKLPGRNCPENPVSDDFIKTITFDNGEEFSGRKVLAAVLGCGICFAHLCH
ncbi:MAG: hypothetical protein LBG27_12855 [Spirochaetaceae bacterium]|jgi:IS30 family transposase|nr:hypothetical protein [Spirochaetaceae bacterium]